MFQAFIYSGSRLHGKWVLQQNQIIFKGLNMVTSLKLYNQSKIIKSKKKIVTEKPIIMKRQEVHLSN